MINLRSGKSLNTGERNIDSAAMLSSVMPKKMLALGFPPIVDVTGVDQCRHVELNQLLVQRIPKFVAHARCRTGALAGVGIDHATDEAELIDAALKLFDAIGGADTRKLRQTLHAAEPRRVELDLAGDDIVRGLGHPAHDGLAGLRMG